jgi:signal peptidase I
MDARRFGRLTVNALCLLVIAFCAAWLVPSMLGYERYVVTGGSMSGTIEKGAVAFEKVLPVAELEVGDVITYQPPPDAGTTSLVTHRIATIRHDQDGRRVFRTKGDANGNVDPWTFSLQREAQPVVAFTVPRAGYVFIALADRTVRMSLIGGPAALIAVLALLEAVRNLRSGEPDRTPARDALPERQPVAA